MTRAGNTLQRIGLYAGLAYLAFVIYGSLVPLGFTYLDPSEAWQAFGRIPYLALGIGSRADWIANILLYIPLTFIWSGVVSQAARASARIAGSLAVLAAAIALCVGIEFAQLYFPPRTVSLNDILAEVIGSVAGIVLWHALGARMIPWLAALRAGGNAGRLAALSTALAIYVPAYLALSLFPFDVVVSSAELAARLGNGRDNLWLSLDAYRSPARCAVQLTLEVLLALPLGIMAVRFTPAFSRTPDRSSVRIALLAGAVLGLTIEGAQLLLNSGVSQGMSVLTRAAGAGLGALACKHLPAERAARAFILLRKARWLALPLVPLYVAGLALLQGWKMHEWLDWDSALQRLPDVHFLPFYYHYFTTETAALVSFWFTSLAYAPPGVLLFWMTDTARRRGMLASAILGALLASVFEFAKLFQRHLHPDPTNVLIGAAAAAAACWLMHWLNAMLTPAVAAHSHTHPATATATPLPAQQADTSAHGGFKVPALVCASLLAWAIADYPLGMHWLAAGLATYLVILYRWQHAWLVLVPAALPVLDLAPLSGRFFADEFDYLLLATIALAYWRWPPGKSAHRLAPAALCVFALFLLSAVSAVLIGASPFPSLDINAFSSYYSPYNALRMGKGLMWAMLLLPLLKHELDRDAATAHRRFAFGMTLGVCAAGASVLWERIAFPGLFNFSSGYRVVGMFSGMHVGGAAIEAYLVLAMPFVAWWSLTVRHPLARLFGASVFALGVYAMVVTYARGGYIALALGMVVLAVAALLRTPASSGPLRAAAGAAVLLAGAAAAWLVVHGTHLNDRFSTSGSDLHARAAHWEDALQMMDDDVATTLFGMGTGRYPGLYLWRSGEGVKPATYGFRNETGNTWLALGGGSPLYVEQIVNVQGNRRYRLSFSARSSAGTGELRLPLCEKWMLYSANCIAQSVRLGETNGQWKRFSVEFDTTRLPSREWYAQRLLKLSIHNPHAASVADIDDVSLMSDDGRELLRNGSFTQGMDHWFFATDNHLPWHIENLWLQLYFEQGAVGLLLFALLAVQSGVALRRRHRDKGLPVPALAAALIGFLALGALNSLFDFPRLSLLFYLLASSAMLQVTPRSRAASDDDEHALAPAHRDVRRERAYIAAHATM
ncbi:VanZ family protein [Noviherbaspirillum cavernae]|nr:VanZ family protein [Noviherbaspirillum cavernae]